MVKDADGFGECVAGVVFVNFIVDVVLTFLTQKTDDRRFEKISRPSPIP